MDAMMGENAGAGKTWPSSAISARPEPMPKTAVTIGSPMASSDPNAMSRTMAAAPMPIPSEDPPYGVSAWSTTSPPRLNVTPWPDAARASLISALASLVGMLVWVTLNCTEANAMWPSREMWPGVVYGSVTAVTCAALRKGPSAPVTRALTRADVIGSADRMASVSVSPDCRGKCWLRMVWPLSVPEKLLLAGAPNCIHSVMRQAVPASHPARVSQRWR